MGYSTHHKGYKCLDIATDRIYISRDVVFDETVFPFADLHPNVGSLLHSEISLLPPTLFSQSSVGSEIGGLTNAPKSTDPFVEHVGLQDLHDNLDMADRSVLSPSTSYFLLETHQDQSAVANPGATPGSASPTSTVPTSSSDPAPTAPVAQQASGSGHRAPAPSDSCRSRLLGSAVPPQPTIPVPLSQPAPVPASGLPGEVSPSQQAEPSLDASPPSPAGS